MMMNSKDHLLAIIQMQRCTVSGEDCNSGKCYLHATCRDTISVVRAKVALATFLSVYGEGELFDAIL